MVALSAKAYRGEGAPIVALAGETRAPIAEEPRRVGDRIASSVLDSGEPEPR